MRASSSNKEENTKKLPKVVSSTPSLKNTFFKPVSKLSSVNPLKNKGPITKSKVKQKERIKRIEEDLKNIKTAKERERESKVYSALISGAFICLVLALSLWYSMAKMKSAFNELEEFTGSGLGLAEPILSKLMFLFEIIFYLSALGFVLFLIAIICKKYQIYEKYVKPKLKARSLIRAKKAGQKTEATKDLAKPQTIPSVPKKPFSLEKPLSTQKPIISKPASNVSTVKPSPKEPQPGKIKSFFSKILGFSKKEDKKPSKKTTKQSLPKKKDNPFLK